MHYHPEALIKDLSAKAQSFRIEVLKMVNGAQTGHIGGAFSAAEIMAALYFHHLRLDPQQPDWPEELDRALADGAIGIKLWTSLKDGAGSLENTARVLAGAGQAPTSGAAPCLQPHRRQSARRNRHS